MNRRIDFPSSLREKSSQRIVLTLDWNTDLSLEGISKNKIQAQENIGIILREFQKHSGELGIRISAIEFDSDYNVYLKTEIV